MKKTTIGITDCGRFENYERWIKNDPSIDIIKLSYHDNSFDSIQECSGIVLTGGQDVHPRFYNRVENMNFYKDKNIDIDEERDVFEWKVLEYSQEKNLPVLGICRGLQLTNVFFGGTLVLDIPLSGKPDHSKIREGEDRYHSIVVTANCLLQQIAGSDTGIVNSAHHQGVDRIADNLTVNAVSSDGIIEGLERKDPNGHPYLMLVQWHPERMNDPRNSFTLKIRESFSEAAKEMQS